jgi:hypothetical protein
MPAEEIARLYPVCRAINRPLTILGTERRLFFLAAIMAGATFNFFASLRAAALIYLALYLAARRVTARDLELPRIFLNSARFKPRYDAARFDPS